MEIDVINFVNLKDIQRALLLDLKRNIRSNEYYRDKICLYINNLKEKEILNGNKINLNLIEKEIFYNIFFAYISNKKINANKVVLKKFNDDIKVINELIGNLEYFSEYRFINFLIDLDLVYEDLKSIFDYSVFNIIFVIARIYGYADRNNISIKNISDVVVGIKNSNLTEMNNQLYRFKTGISDKRYVYFFNALKPFILDNANNINWDNNDYFPKEITLN